MGAHRQQPRYPGIRFVPPEVAGSTLAVEATRRMEQLMWESVKNANDPKPLQDFLVDFPGGAYAQQATAALETLQQLIGDRQAVVDVLSRYAEVFGRKTWTRSNCCGPP